MCKAYAEIGLFVVMCLMCSRCRIPIDLPVWSTYELLQVLHFKFYMPLEFILFSGILSQSWLYMIKPTKDTAMGSPTSSTLAKIYLQFFEELTIRQWLENGEISYYTRYADGILIIFDQNKINEKLITNYIIYINFYNLK